MISLNGPADRRFPDAAELIVARFDDLLPGQPQTQQSRVSGLGIRAVQPVFGSSRLRAARRMRSPGCQVGLPT